MRLKHVLFLFLGTFFLTSCSVTEDGLDFSSTNVSDCEKSGGEFCAVEGTSFDLELIVTSDNPAQTRTTAGNCDAGSPYVQSNNSNVYCFDISGKCKADKYDANVIVGRADTVTRVGGSTILANQPLSLGSCKKGRFAVQLRAELTNSQLCKPHKLTLELIGKNIDGSEEKNPTRAKKSIHYSVPLHETCGS